MTGNDLISSSMRLIGAIASGESLSSNDANDALSALNAMIDSWSTQRLFIPSKVREVFPFVASQQTYTMGTGANWNTTRPQKIERALIQIATVTPVLELPMNILTMEQYAGILIKPMTSTYPLYLYSDNAYPNTNISVWPVPVGSVNNIVLYSWKPLTTITTLSTAISLPPGYIRALKFGLAVELAPEFGKQVSPEVSSIADSSRADIKRMNFSPDYLRVDDALVSKPAVWNWMTGEPT